MLYTIENRIQTLAENAVMQDTDPAAFSIDDVVFSHWEFSLTHGWLQDSWIAKTEVEAPNFREAYQQFRLKIRKLVPRIAFISQCYTESINQPFLIQKNKSSVAFFRFVKDTRPVPLMFMEDELKALELLLTNSSIPEEFYYYWNDAVNTTGYTPKLLLMFSALEALTKSPGANKWGTIEAILGTQLKDAVFAPNSGLRHRLIHGEYFSPEDPTTNYLDIIHNKVLEYFNTKILNDHLLHGGVINPQRHFFGNLEECKMFIRPKANTQAQLILKDVLTDFEKNGIHQPERYEILFDDTLNKTY